MIETNYHYNILPSEIINVVLEYDGRIKYKKGKYVNVIHKHDERYSRLEKIIAKKLKIMKRTEICYNAQNEHQFYFEFSFDICNNVGLVYDYNFTFPNTFEICYFDMRNGWEQIRTHFK
jgi:hypothetical protein